MRINCITFTVVDSQDGFGLPAKDYEFTIHSFIHKGSPFKHPTKYAVDYGLGKAVQEVKAIWEKRLELSMENWKVFHIDF